MSATEAKNAGMIRVGVWGYSSRDAGYWYATPENYDAVKAAYDAAEESNPHDDAEIKEAGGVYVRD